MVPKDAKKVVVILVLYGLKPFSHFRLRTLYVVKGDKAPLRRVARTKRLLENQWRP